MSKTLETGLTHEFQFVVTESKTVPHLFPEAPEFQEMPKALATGFLVGLVEWTCAQAVMPYLDWPEELTVGTHMDLSHLAATPPGFTVTVRVELVEMEGRRLVFSFEADDGVDVICRGRHERFQATRDRFLKGLAAKQG